MTTKTLVALGCVAVALAGVAFWAQGRKGHARTPQLNGEKMVESFDVSKAASIDIGDKVKLAAGDKGWTIPMLQDAPADRAKIAENLMKLQELKVGQVVRGRTLAEPLKVTVRDAQGGELASVTLGERHATWGMGRYAQYKGETVLVADTLDDFGNDPEVWREPKKEEPPKEEPPKEEPKKEEPKKAE